jgi:transposase
MDVHKETIAVAVADGVTNEVRFVGEIVNTPEAINK